MTPSQLKHTQFVMFSAERNRILSTLQTRAEVTRGANLCRVCPAERALFSHCRTLICTDTAPGLPLRSETSTTVQNIAARQRCKCQRKSAEDRSEGTQRRGSSSTQPPGAAARPPPPVPGSRLLLWQRCQPQLPCFSPVLPPVCLWKLGILLIRNSTHHQSK